jgi:hypothetical protein
VADEILIESNEEPFPEIHARDMRGERITRESEPAPEPEPEPEPESEPELEYEPEPTYEPEPEYEPEPAPEPAAVASPLLLEEEEIDTSEMERLTEDATHQPHLEGVTPSDDWAYDDPEDYSAPV